jgi:DNA-directed RNA polymerase specialized sigma24 family protein
MANHVPRKSLAQLKAEAGCYVPVPADDKRLILQLADVREDLRATLAREQAAWDERKASLMRQIGDLSNAKIAEKFGCSLSQVRTVIQGVAGQSL